MSNDHWNGIYRTRPDHELGWYESTASTLDDVLDLLNGPHASVIDVGAGTSRLVDGLLGAGYRDLTVLDISAAALDATSARLAAATSSEATAALSVSLLEADVTGFYPDRRWDLWHDRAVFHFLVDDAQRAGYVAGIDRALDSNGHAIIATFAESGPESCAGLAVRRYSEATLAAEFDGVLECIGSRTTTAGAINGDRRPYTVCRFSKT